MSRTARCPIDAFERGALPAVCVTTGAPAEGWYTDRFESRVGAQWLLLLVGLLPFLVVRALTRKTAKGRVPVSREAFAAMTAAGRRRTRWLVGLGLGGVVAAGSGLAVVAGDRAEGPVGPSLLVLGVVLLVAAGAVGARRTVPGHVEASGRWVVLEDVHPAFAAAVDQAVRTGG